MRGSLRRRVILAASADLVAADGFLLKQGGSQPVEGFPVARRHAGQEV
jgi:hypothetical protein